MRAKTHTVAIVSFRSVPSRIVSSLRTKQNKSRIIIDLFCLIIAIAIATETNPRIDADRCCA